MTKPNIGISLAALLLGAGAAHGDEKSALDRLRSGDEAFTGADYAQARQRYEQAQAELAETTSPLAGEILNHLAAVALEQGRSDEFADFFTRAKTLKQAFAGVLPAQSSGTLLNNGGFEDGLIFPWGTGHYERTDGKFGFGVWWNSMNVQAFMKIDYAEKYRGCCALRITNHSPAAPHVFTTLSQRIAGLEPNAVYKVSGYAKARDLSAGAVSIAVDAAWGKRIPALPPGTYDWQPFTATVNIGHNDYIDFRILHVNTGTVWLDELRVEKVAAEGEVDPIQQLESLYDAGHYAEALTLAQQLEERFRKQKGGLARVRWYSGRVYQVLGNYRLALDKLRWALDNGIPRAAFELGQAYYRLGEHARAEQYLKQAYQTVRGDQGTESLVLNQLSLCYLAQNRLDDAIEAQRQSYHILKHIEDRHGQAQALLQLGRIYQAQGNHAAAFSEFEQARLLARQLDDPQLASDALLYLADSARLSGRPAQASMSEALREKQSLHDPLGLVGALALQSRLLRTDSPAAAVLFGKQAVNLLQTLRLNLAQIDKALQQAFLQDKSVVYQELADLLIELGRLPEAQQVLNLLKEDEYFDFVRRDEEAAARDGRVSYNALEQVWAARYAEIQDKLAALGKELGDLRQKARQGELSGPEQARRGQLQADLQVASQAFDAYLQELRTAFMQADALRAREFGETVRAQLQSLQGTLRQLGHGSVLVQYLIAPSKLHIILTTPEAQLAREAPVGAAELSRAILDLRRKLEAPIRGPLQESQRLYRWLIQPLEADLQEARARLLMLSLDGALRYVPVAALHDGKQYVVERYALAMYTEAARGNLTRAPLANWRIAGLGVSEAVRGFSPLPGVAQELEQLVLRGAKDRDGVAEGILRLNRDFTSKAFLGVLDEGYPVIHIASHFVFTPGTEKDSYLLLGDGGRITLADIRSHYDFNAVDLLTLSACNTAVGGSANGREIEGFGALAQNRGAKGVLATLWAVSDASTGRFMVQLYRNRATLSKAEALQQAQQSMLREGKFRHPYFWAPFVLLGNWL
ncbi:MAG TPA: CHAT domain-containing protein [Methylococcaceae bacterium]|nr:CHAT domain-containing protein [Methylococcaceae bacterium]